MVRLRFWKNKKKLEPANNTKTIRFTKLTPSHTIDIAYYKEALDFALLEKENQDITNIAITGPYGAGKSSVIESYIKGSELQFLNISLSHYKGTGDVETNELEEKIVNQLLHQVDHKKIPQTIFKIKNRASRLGSFGYAISIVGVAALIYGWSNIGTVKSFVSSIAKPEISPALFNIVWLALIGIFSVFLVYKLIKLQLDKGLVKSLKIGGSQFDIRIEDDESYFDKFMNDVVYLFINSDADAIVFEDLDRFEDSMIYEKLREINGLINKRIKTKTGMMPFLRWKFWGGTRDKKVSFLYLVKDDMFKSKDRTKFFDFIIPVVPVMDGSNSYEMLWKMLKNLSISEDFRESKSLLKKLSLYVDDYRLLKNVANEYVIYKNRLGNAFRFNKDKLFALLLYKNLFPKDFSVLQYGNSFLNLVFSQKQNLADIKSADTKKEIQDLDEKIAAANSERLESINELDAIYLKNIPNYDIMVDGKVEQDFENRSDFVAAIKKSDFKVKRSAQNTAYAYNRNFSDYDMKEDFDKLKGNETYTAKYKSIENKSEFNSKKLRKDKLQLTQKLNKIQSMNITELLEDQDSDFFKNLILEASKQADKSEENTFSYLKENEYFPLLVLMLREELIDEKYNDYMTYFYEGALSKNDKEFIRSIYDRNQKVEDYHIDNPKGVIEDITINDFSGYEIKNYDLSVYILENRQGYEDYWQTLIGDLKENDNVDFVYELYMKANDEQRNFFFEAINKDWDNLIISIVASEDLDEAQKIQYISDYIYYSDYEIIKELNQLEILINFIGNSNFICETSLPQKDLSNQLSKLEKLGVKFFDLSNPILKQEVIKKITELKMFVITKANIMVIFNVFGGKIDDKIFYDSNFSVLKGMKNSTINSALFDNNINQYFITYLGFGSEALSDEMSDVKEVLNSDKLKQEIKFDYINRLKLNPKLLKISDVNDKELWWAIAKTHNLESTEENIVNLLEYNEWKLREEIVGLINSAPDLLSYEKLELDSDTILKVFEAIVNSEGIEERQYISILKSLKRFYKQGVPETLPNDRLRLLIEHKIIAFTEDNLKSIRLKHSQELVNFVFANFDDYMETIKGDEYFENEELVDLLQSDRFTLEQNKRLIQVMEYPLSIQHGYKDPIKQYILENRFDENDLNLLIESFTNLSDSIANSAYMLISEKGRLASVIDDKTVVPRTLLLRLLKDTNIPLEYRHLLFANNIPNLSELEIVELIKNLSLPDEFIRVLNKGRIKIKNTKLNLEIAEQYKKKDWIGKFTVSEDELALSGRQVLEKEQ